MTHGAPPLPSDPSDPSTEAAAATPAGPGLGRRSLLSKASAAAAGLVAGAAVVATGAAEPAGAANGEALLLGNTGNVASLPTGLRVDSPASSYGLGVSDGPIAQFPRAGTISAHCGPKWYAAIAGSAIGATKQGVVGYAEGSNTIGGSFVANGDDGIGVAGQANMVGSVTEGVGGQFLGGRANIKLVPHGDPHEEEFWSPQVGDVVCDSTGNLYFATYGPSGVRYLKLAGPQSAGAFHAITPTRAEDSREPGRGGRLGAGETRTLDLSVNLSNAGALIPYKASAAVINLTITQTQGQGFLTLWPFGEPRPDASTINWSQSGQGLSNGATIKLGSAQRLSVFCGGGGTTELVVDVNGYYR